MGGLQRTAGHCKTVVHLCPLHSAWCWGSSLGQWGGHMLYDGSIVKPWCCVSFLSVVCCQNFLNTVIVLVARSLIKPQARRNPKGIPFCDYLGNWSIRNPVKIQGNFSGNRYKSLSRQSSIPVPATSSQRLTRNRLEQVCVYFTRSRLWLVPATDMTEMLEKPCVFRSISRAS